MKDPYATLGVAKNATEKEIRSAFRRLAKQYHPDYSPNDSKAEERFKAVNNAYAILGDKEKKARFDRGEINAQGQEQGPFGGASGPFGGGGFHGGMGAEDLGDIFSNIFGGGFGQSQSRKGRDYEGSIHISFLESVLGAKKEVRLASGEYITVTIPAGIEDGKKIRVKGKGEAGFSGRAGMVAPAGDLLLKVSIAADKIYKREGRNLRLIKDIDLETAVLGGKVEIPTPQGMIALTIKPHSDSGILLRIPNRGVAADKKHEAGHLYVELRVKLGEISSALEDFCQRQRGDA